MRDEGGRRRQAYDVFLRGGLGPLPAIARPVFRRVPTEELDDAVDGLVGGWLGRARRRRDVPGVLRPADRRRARARWPAASRPARAREGGRHEHVELIDDLEAGELSVEFEGEEPEDVLEWALERFSPRIALSTAFQADGVALLRHGVRASTRRPRVQRRHRAAARRDVRADRADARALPRHAARAALAERAAARARWSASTGPNLFYRQRREPPALLPGAQGAAAAAPPRRARRLDHRPAPRPVGDAHATSARSRSTTTTARS